MWGHVTSTALRPPLARIVTPTITVVANALGINAVANAAVITQEMVNLDTLRLEDFDAAVARTNYVLLQTLEAKDVMATMMLPTPKDKWNKLSADYAAISASMASVVGIRFHVSRCVTETRLFGSCTILASCCILLKDVENPILVQEHATTQATNTATSILLIYDSRTRQCKQQHALIKLIAHTIYIRIPFRQGHIIASV